MARALVSACWLLSVGLSVSLPVHLLIALPDEDGAKLSKGWRRTLEDLDEEMNASVVLVPNNVTDILDAVCDSLEEYRPHVLLSFLGPRRTFYVNLIAGHTGLPTLTVTGDYTGAAQKQINQWLVSLDPSPEDLSDALFHFLVSQDWFQVTLLLDGSTFSGSVAARLSHLMPNDHLRVLQVPTSRLELLGVLSGCHSSRSRVLVVCCSRAGRVLAEARRLRMLQEDWVWILLEKATLNPESGNYPAGVIGFRLKHPTVNKYSVRSVMNLVAESVKYLEGNFKLVHRQSNITCWNGPPDPQRRRLTEALYTVIRRQLERESSVSREGLEPSTFDVLHLVTGPHTARRRWRRLGHVIGPAVHLDRVVWGWHRVTRGQRPRFRVATAYAPPFVIPGTRMHNGSCLVGVVCLHFNTSSRAEIVSHFADYHAGRNEGVSYEVLCCGGLSIALLLSVSRDLGFAFDLYLVSDGLFGNNATSGITADLVSGAAHMTFTAFSLTSARQQLIDFTVPFFHSGVSCLTSSQYRDVPLSAFLVPFSIQLWVAIFCGLTATAVAAAIYEWLSPFGLNPWGRQRTKNFSLASALWVMWSLLFSHLVAFKAPKSWPNKVLINVWGCFSVIFLASYTANIAALFAGLFFHLRVDDFHDTQLLSLRTGTAKGSAAEFYVHKENNRLWQHIQPYGVHTLQKGLESLRNKDLDVLIGDTAVLNYFRGNDPGCNLHLLGDSIFDDAYAVGVQKGFPLKDAISSILMRYSAYGYVDQLQKRWYGRVPCFDDRLHRFNQPEPLSVAAVAGLFLMLAAGVGVGLLILLMEHLCFRYALPVLRMRPKGCIWRSPNLMFFSQKLYRFINTVELVSPHHSVKEIISNLKEGQIASLFQKSVKKKFKEEARRRKSKSQFFDLMQEIRKVVRQQNDPPPSMAWEEPKSPSPPTVTWVPEIRCYDASLQDLAHTSVLLHRSYNDSHEDDDVSSSASLRVRLSASTGDLMDLQVREHEWRKFRSFPRIRSLDDLTTLDRREESSTFEVRSDSNLNRSSCQLDALRLLSLHKEDIVRMWQDSERNLLNRLHDVLKEKRLLQQKLAFVQKTLLKPP